MSADTLRRAAALIRERAEAATPGPWRAMPINGDKRADVRGLPENTSYDYRGDAVATAADSGFGACPAVDAAHIAAWHPAVALAVANLLDVEAAMCEEFAIDEAETPESLTVARAYLGDSA